MKKGILRHAAALCMAFIFVAQTVSASVLGDAVHSGSVSMGYNTGTYYYNNVFVNENNVRQSEYYFEYTPNSNVVPIVTNGEELYGRRTLTEAAEYIEEQGWIPVMGINADYFSYKTGLPMGHEIIDGELVSKSQECQQAVGFRADGTAFMEWLQIKTTLTYNGVETEIGNINKWRQDVSVPAFLLTDDYVDSIKTDSPGYVMVLSKVEGSLSLRENLKLKVEETFEYDGDVAIPEGKYIITIGNQGDEAVANALKSIPVGAEVEISNRDYYNPELWKEAEYAMSSVGGRILEDGVIPDGLSKTREPRSAVGIKADGTVVFYLVDGRQTEHSAGVSLVDLAERLKEIGCVDAINLDGGGSSAIGATADNGEFTVFNSPSDGGLRKCANYIFLQDVRKPTNIVGQIDIQQEQDQQYLSGTQFSITFDAIYDTNGFNMYLVDDMSYSIVNEGGAMSTVDENGLVTAAGNGTSTVWVSSGEASASLTFTVTDTLTFGDTAGHWAENYISDMAGAGIVAGADDGNFYPEREVTRAEFAVMLSRLTGLESDDTQTGFADDDQIPSWAKGAVAAMADAGVINGKTDASGKIYFAPNDKLTRAEAAAMLEKLIDKPVMSSSSSGFSDEADIPSWAVQGVDILSGMGIISGYDDGTFKPQNNVKRAEAVKMLYGIMPEDDPEEESTDDTAKIVETEEEI